MSDKFRLEDNIEEIMLGLDLGTDSGEYHNTEIVDGKLQLKQIEGSDEYESEGYWVSEVIDLEYKFKDYQKVSLDKDTVEGSEVVIEYRTSDNESDILKEEWKMTEPDGKFSGETKQFIQVKLNLVPKNEPVDNVIGFKSEEDIEKLSEEDREYFKVEDEKLFLNDEISIESEFIDGVNIVELPKEKFSEIESLSLEGDMSTGAGSQELIAGDLERGFYGEVPASEIFTAEELSDLLGITQGNIQFNDTPWLKFAYKGKTLFRPKKAFRSHISWDHINSKGAVYGGKVVEHEAGYRFDVRLVRGISEKYEHANGGKWSEVCPNSEWNHLMLPIHIQAKDASWAYPAYVEDDVPYWGIDYTDMDLQLGSGNGRAVWCQEHYNASSTDRVNRGNIGVSIASNITSSSTSASRGWAPVLELLVTPKKILIKKDSDYGYYTEDSTQFISLGTEQPTEEQFNEFGMPDLTILDSERLSDLLEAESIQILNLPESEEDTDTLVVKGELKGQFIHLEQPINSSEIDRLITQDNSVGVRYLFSNNKTEWKVLSPDSTWETVDWEDNSELLQKGMSKNAIRDVKSEQWDNLGESLYVGIYISDNSSYVESITQQVYKAINTPKISDAKLYILNTKATIDLQFKSNTLFGSLTDDDTGKVQYKVILNGENLVPEDDEFTELSPSPENINIPIPKDKIKQGETNTIEVQFQDAWGSMDTWSTTFIGREFGILFMDEDEVLYSDAQGNILKPLELGDVIIGEPTDSQVIKLKNDTELDLENVIIQSVLSEEIDGTTFLFSLDSEGEYTKQLKLPKLALDEVITFYVKLDTVLDVTPEIKSDALFTVKATGVNPTL